jgi:hypothetical protein
VAELSRTSDDRETQEPTGLQLVHDVHDVCLKDRNGKKVGRVDALALIVGDDGRLRVSAILVGGPVRARRIGHWMVWLHHLMCVAFHADRSGGVSRIPFSAVRCIADTVELDVDADTLPSGHLERWLDRRIISHIPGASGEKK